MGFWRTKNRQQFKINKFKQNKPNTEKKSWHLSPVANQRLALWGDKVTERFKVRLSSQPTKGTVPARARTARQLWLRKKFKIAVRYGRSLLNNRQKGPVKINKMPRKVAYFVRFGRHKAVSLKSRTRRSMGALKQFRLPKRFSIRVLKTVFQKATADRWSGAFALASFKTAHLEKKFWSRYKLAQLNGRRVKKQEGYDNRHFGPTNLYRAVVLKTAGSWWVKKTTATSVFRPFIKAYKGSLAGINTKRKAVLWRRAALRGVRGWRFLRLNFKFYKRPAQGVKLSTAGSFRANLRQREWVNSKFSQLRYLHRKPYAKFSIKRLEALQRRWRAKVVSLGYHPYRRADKVLLKELVHLSKKINTLKAPVPWWKKKKTNKQHGKFVKKFQVGWQNSRSLMRVRWFKLVSRRYKAFNNSGVSWGGADKGALVQKYSLLQYKKKRKKIGLHYMSPVGGLEWKKLYAAYKLSALKNLVASHPTIGQGGFGAGTKTLVKRPLLLSVRQAARAFDFNKFFKVNKAVAKNINDISVDLYSQYVENLQEGCSASNNITVQNGGNNAHARRALRKYITLLLRYFKEVYDTKMAKNIPASSAMHWIRAYLRLTGGTWRRNSLWNRFNKVAFNFKPKAKEDEKRGRKKKILFKAKILFDRLFNWLYAQPNARYALAAPIQKGVIRDYIVRNQFIFKKGFKMKVPAKKS